MNIPFSTSLAIWFRAHCFNAALSFLAILIFLESEGAYFAIIGAAVGLVISLPVLLVVHFITKAVMNIPYSLPSRMIGLGFFLGMLALFCWVVLLWCFGIDWREEGSYLLLLALVSVISVFLSVFTLHSTFIRYEEEANTAEREILDSE